MRRRIVTTVAGGLGAALALAACSSGGGGGEADTGDVSSLSVLDYYNNDPDNSLIQAGLDSCAEELGITLERETVPGADLIQTVLQQASSQTLPDVLMLDNPDVQQIAETGALVPLDENGVSTDGFAQGVIDASTYDGNVYGLQPVANTLALFYNTDVLAEAGVEPPTTWDELREAAATLTEGDQYGISFSAINTYEGTWQFLPPMWTNGGDETDLTSPEVAEALQLWVDLVESGSASESVINWSQGDAKDQFMAGRAAMMVNGPWNIPSMNEMPDVNWDVVQFPVNDPSQTPVAPLGGEAWTVPVTGDEASQAVAVDFVECLNTPEQQLDWAVSRYTIPTRTDLAEDFLAERPEMEAFAEQVANARSRTGELGPEWPDAATVIYEAIQLALTGQASADEAFAQASAR
ncbi:sugar ABC transporter substrate-binding protein [Ruania alba]|uniref:Carbohydrate ABC transporter substrate-binding protein, CUT1 family n=1 Tax=Ruania alba TaxID=648782 RepID=A0A1H5HS75_9MICO|nr:ABC transporter substrate-binding protein [Ruania alba]SEE30783.1 carbohydrate ABC transporter substrate-binding protein, CUT1 family [Ruania alba]